MKKDNGNNVINMNALSREVGSIENELAEDALRLVKAFRKIEDRNLHKALIE